MNVAFAADAPLTVTSAQGGPVVLDHPPANVGVNARVQVANSRVPSSGSTPTVPQRPLSRVPKVSGFASGGRSGGCGCGGCGGADDDTGASAAPNTDPTPELDSSPSAPMVRPHGVSGHDVALAVTITVAILAALYIRKKVNL